MITDTKDKIRQMIEFDGSLTNVQLARALGISRQAVSKHARGMFLNRSANPNRSCIGCGRRVKKLSIKRRSASGESGYELPASADGRRVSSR